MVSEAILKNSTEEKLVHGTTLGAERDVLQVVNEDL